MTFCADKHLVDRKAPGIQHALFELLTSWQTSLSRGEFVGLF